MDCIYCSQPADDAEGVAHVFPEAIVKNEQVLPHGTVCDQCNNYLGTHLDAELQNYPWISFAIQILELPGKGGRPRKRAGITGLDDDGSVTVDISKPARVDGSGMEITVAPGENFDMGKFRRAIHHIAFNIMALDRGAPHARKAHFNPVRKYIRRPQKRETWPLVQVLTHPLHKILPEVKGRLVREAPSDTVCVRLFNLDFYVDLVNRGALGSWAHTEFGDEASYIPEDWQPTEIATLKGKHRYRMRIHPE